MFIYNNHNIQVKNPKFPVLVLILNNTVYLKLNANIMLSIPKFICDTNFINFTYSYFELLLKTGLQP